MQWSRIYGVLIDSNAIGDFIVYTSTYKFEHINIYFFVISILYVFIFHIVNVIIH